MAHSYSKIWVHAVWATKNRQPLITLDIEQKVYDFMYEQFKEIGCSARVINGMPDHVHSLFLLSNKVAIAEVLKQVKGATSHYVNSKNLIDEKFSWQTGYASYSVSESIQETVYRYIKNQKQHHLKNSFQTEFDDFIKLHHAHES